ncbi:cyclic nucleotide-binding domain-containing protein [Streptomyces cyaneofuscatus]|nr:cyclic nucleotide-binding domain-containing protein [Streptomyces cyaneofuscatus]WTF36463.1 cyclic nucleotide-binding domain-containing protein [Streptomyces cyaneofuscatus]
MRTLSPARLANTLTAHDRKRLMEHGHEANFLEGTRLFEEGSVADRFWIVRSGTVTLDMRVPGRNPALIERLGPGELVGWSWLLRPYTWHNSAEAETPVRAYEFNAVTVRMAMDADPAFGSLIGNWVTSVLAYRLQGTRLRLLDEYALHGGVDTV